MPGAPEGIRTPDPRLRRPMLYPTELQAHHRRMQRAGSTPTPADDFRWYHSRRGLSIQTEQIIDLPGLFDEDYSSPSITHQCFLRSQAALENTVLHWAAMPPASPTGRGGIPPPLTITLSPAPGRPNRGRCVSRKCWPAHSTAGDPASRPGWTARPCH